MARKINYEDDELITNPFAFAEQAPVNYLDSGLSAEVASAMAAGANSRIAELLAQTSAAAPAALVAPPLAELGPSRRGDVQPAPTGQVFDQQAAIRRGIIEVPKPPEIVAEEKRIGREIVPFYQTGSIERGQGGASQQVEYGAPVGYRYDNGQSQYVNYDTSGVYQGTEKRQPAIDPATLAVLLAPILGPMAFEALGLTGAAGGGGLLGEAAVLGGAGELATAANLTPAAIESLLGTAGYGVNASALEAALAAGIPAATVGAGAGGGLLGETAVLGAGEAAAGASAANLTPAAMESLLGTAGYGVNASALEAAAAAGIPAAQVGAGALEEFQGATAIPPKLTPAAIESGLGTPGYGVNASAIESGLFNPETIGAGAYLPFDGVTPSIVTVPEPSSLPSWVNPTNALLAASAVSSIAKANETSPTAAPFTMAPYVPPSGKPFANIAMSPIATPYTPTRIAGQYDPTKTPGGVSPYELIMQQMQAPKNLYADFEAGINIGGFDPQRFVTPAAPSNFNGGMIDKSRMVGPNPMGPDNGFASIQDGEFVMNRKATQKYGIELMNAINSGKISKGKLSGLLEA